MTDWIKTTLGEVVSSGDGILQTGPFGSQLHASDYVEKGIPCIMPANMNDTYIDLSRIAFISKVDANRLSRHLVKVGDLVYSRRGDVTQKVLIREGEEGYFCGTGCILVRPGKNVNSEFLLYYLCTPSSKNWIIGNAVGATMPNINTKILSNYPLKLPNKENQIRISNVLSNLDNKINLNVKINEKLEAMAKLIYDYWFVQFDFPDKNGKPYKSSGGKMVYNKELKREIPEGWEFCYLGDVVESTGTGLNPRDNFVLGEGDNFYVTIKNIEQGRVILDEKCDKVSDEALETINQRSDLKKGDILYTSIQPVGTTYLIREKPTNWNINESVFTIRPDYEKVTSEFLYMFLSGDYIKAYTKNVSTGSIHKGVRHGVLKECKIILPSREIVDLFTNKIVAMLDKSYLIQNENQQLTELRDWLLPMLMNGQVTVGGVEEEVLGMVAEKESEYKTN